MAASFLGEFLSNPFRTAAVAPSSRFLAAAMLTGIDFARVRTVVEYGPGTGVFTRAVLDALRGADNRNASFIAIELNERLASKLASDHPEADVRHANALDVDKLLGDRYGAVDLVVSGLGWPSIPLEPREAILKKTRAALRPGGRFHTFGYHIGLCMPGAWHFRRTVRDLFDNVSVSPVVWRNLPPAFVYRCAVRSADA